MCKFRNTRIAVKDVNGFSGILILTVQMCAYKHCQRHTVFSE